MFSPKGNLQMDVCTIRKAVVDGNILFLREFINDKAVLNKFVNGDPYVFYEILRSAICTHRGRSEDVDNVDEINDDIILQLIKAAKEVHFGFIDEKTLLMVALENCRSYKIIVELIQAGSDVNAISKDDFLTPLMYALDERNEKNIIAELISKGADINYRDCDACTPLFYGMRDNYDRPDVIEMLLNAGSNFHDLDCYGRNILMYNGCKCFKGTDCRVKESIDVLRKFGIDDIGLNRTSDEGNSILHETHCSYVFELAIRSGVSIEAKNNKGRTPLLENIRWKPPFYKDKLVYLLRSGANMHSTDQELQTVLHLCSFIVDSTVFPSTIDMLIYHGGNMFAGNMYDLTPLDLMIGKYNYKEFPFVFLKHIIPFDDNEFSFGIKALEKFYNRADVNSFIAACKKELNLMKETFIADRVTFYDFFILKRYCRSKLVNISPNEYRYGCSEINKLFPIYGNVIVIRFKDNRLKKREFDLRKRFERIILSPVHTMETDIHEVLNYDCFYHISKYLNYKEMFNIFSAAIES